uniref:Uncharacterized LOC113124239 n=1 Tax=Mastacembelus armatus TaxID=205130 RepID=A0A3Q3LT31_9TELE
MDEKLILAVFNYPELYNVTLPNYRCTESRANAWRNISSVLGLSCKCLIECKRKWKNMRDRYLKEVRMEIKSKKQGEMVQSRWKYRQLMNFIAPFTGSRSGVADICGNDDDNDNPDNESGSVPVSQPDLKPQVVFGTQVPSMSQDTQMGPLAITAKPRDEDELFLLSFVPALKRLAPQKRCETKIKIQQIMYEAEFSGTQPESKEKQTGPETLD